MVTHLKEQATYASFKAWLLVVEDWLLSNTHTMPDNLGPVTIHTVAHLTMNPDVYSCLERQVVHWGQRRLIGLDG